MANHSMTNAVIFDIESTGIDERLHIPIEIGGVVFNRDLEIVDTVEFVLNPAGIDYEALMCLGQDGEYNDFVHRMHSENGLLQELRDGAYTNRSKVDSQLAEFVAEHGVAEKMLLSGDSMHFDRLMLRQHLPKTFHGVHYHSLDISSIIHYKEFVLDQTIVYPPNRGNHRALPDALYSLEKLRYLKALDKA